MRVFSGPEEQAVSNKASESRLSFGVNEVRFMSMVALGAVVTADHTPSA